MGTFGYLKIILVLVVIFATVILEAKANRKGPNKKKHVGNQTISLIAL